ncbi:VanZ family protein [Streptomyces sp. WAC 00631]|uniref:VanZ family protein n=1 Tax=unclassified Streptomyces TaxID=2593676 RepID=UPI000F7A72BD|nr:MULTISPECIES: VanZ family protein [unclassified Streptomyces]MCC5035184.1 VanZ family protein [Streptomyces sp. WAC 00631]MCC9739771.1 VanZ family protein [Streptomyces sp. MNU89]
MQRHGCGARAAFRFRATGLVLLFAHLLYVAWTALRPPALPWVTAAHLQPLATVRAELALGLWPAVQHLGGALLLLAPLGVLLPWAAGRLEVPLLSSLTRTVFTGVMVSLGLALLQTNLSGRTLDVDSLVLHTLGIALAHLALVPALRGWLRRLCERAGRASPAVPASPGRPGGLPAEEPPQGPPLRIPRVGAVPWTDVSSPSWAYGRDIAQHTRRLTKESP